MFRALLILLGAVSLWAQPAPGPPFLYVTTDPTGNACTVGSSTNRILITTATIYVCEGSSVGSAGTFAASGGGGAATSIDAGGATSVTNGTNGDVLTIAAGKVSHLTPTGSGSPVYSTSPTLVTPNLGTPSTLVLTNATGLPHYFPSGSATGIGPTSFSPGSITLYVQDATASTGATRFFVRAGAGDSATVSIASFLSSSGTANAGFDQSGDMFAVGTINDNATSDSATYKIQAGFGFFVGNTGGYAFLGANTVGAGTYDLALRRGAAGRLDVSSSYNTICDVVANCVDLRTRLTQTMEVAVASLQTCDAAHAGARQAVNDSNAVSFTAGIGAVVANGGSTHVPVYCDGTNWRIG